MVSSESTNSWNRDIPLLVRRGGRDSKKMPRSLLIGADGGRSPRKPDRAQPSRKSRRSHRNVTCERPPRLRRLGGLRRNFLDAAATPPHEEGTTLAHLVAASPRCVSVSLWFPTAIDGVPQGFEASTRGFSHTESAPIRSGRRSNRYRKENRMQGGDRLAFV